MPPSEEERRVRNTETVRTYYRLQEAQDLDTWLTLWTTNGTQAIPYAPKEFPTSVAGRSALETIYRDLFAGYAELRILDLRIDPLHNPDHVLARWHTHAELIDGGTYDNDLIGLFEFTPEGKIHHFTEYFNPTAFDTITRKS